MSVTQTPCPQCQAPNPPTARWCVKCAHPLEAEAPPAAPAPMEFAFDDDEHPAATPPRQRPAMAYAGAAVAVLAGQGRVQLAGAHPARIQAHAGHGQLARTGQQPAQANRCGGEGRWPAHRLVSHASPYYWSGSLTPLAPDGSTAYRGSARASTSCISGPATLAPEAPLRLGFQTTA